MWRTLGLVLVSGFGFLAGAAGAQCTGDCDGDGEVRVNELVTGVSIASGSAPLDRCPAFDADGDGEITVAELVRAVSHALSACPTPAATDTPTATPSPTPTSSPTPTPSVTASPTRANLPPVLVEPALYRTWASFPVELALEAEDPDGDELAFDSPALPAGAILDGSGVLRWTPAPAQIGPHIFPVEVHDDRASPLADEGTLRFQVYPNDACTEPDCDPAQGCQAEILPPDQSCCASGPVERVPEIAAPCPGGRALFVGRNNLGFGRLNNCQELRVISSFQAGTFVRFNLEARCVEPVQARVEARLETADLVVFDTFGSPQTLRMLIRDDGFAEARSIVFEVPRGIDAFALEGEEAQLTVTLTDFEGVVVTEVLRVILTLDPVDDLPDLETVS